MVSANKLKILCLHGFAESGAVLKEQLRVWPSDVVENVEFVFIDAPIPLTKKTTPSFSWFRLSQGSRVDDRSFESSIAYIEECMVKLGPFHGVLGFSQGAYIAAALPGMQKQGVALSKVEDIKFVMIISGGKLGGIRYKAPKLAQNAFSYPIQIPSLHCFGEHDLAKLTAIDLLGSIVEPFVIYHSGGHEVPKLDEDEEKVLLSFLKKIQALQAERSIQSLL